MRLPSLLAARPTCMLSPLRSAALLLLASAFAGAASAQSLPATPPTAMPTPAGPIAATPVSRATRPTVTYADGLLDVRASNASLQQILRIISRQTGMRITGGVPDQRVFGNYGPAEPGAVLATLLDGTGVNVLVHEDASHKPLELVLTPRSGGAFAPMASASTEDDGPDPSTTPAATSASGLAQSPAQTVSPAITQNPVAAPPATSAQNPTSQTPTGPQTMPQPLNNVLGNPANTTPTASQIPTTNSVPLDSLPTPSTTTQTAQGIVDSTNPPPPGAQNTGTPAPATPEQIYQQLLKLQQQQQQSKPPAPQ